MHFSNDLTTCDVLKWLKDLFQDEMEIPDLAEENIECITVLEKIMRLCKEGDKDVSEIIKTDLYLADYYTKKSRTKDTITSSYIMNLPTNDLEFLNLTSSFAVQLSLRQPSITNFLLSLSFLENKSQDDMEEHIINIFNKSIYDKKIAESMQKNAIMERKMESLEKVVSKQQTLKLKQQEKNKFLRMKSKEYKNRIKKLQKELSGLGFTPSLSHSALVKKAEEVQCLESDVKNLTAKLNRYQNLPANKMLARLKVEELKAKLLETQKKFQELLEYSQL